MFKIKYVPPAEAEGQVKENYSLFPEGMEPPAPFQLYSASPGVQQVLCKSLGYFMSHPKLSAQLQAAIRYLGARLAGFPYCVEFNGGMLTRMGAGQAELDAMVDDPSKAPLEPNEVVLFGVVADMLRNPALVTKEVIERCRQAGWSDSDIFDACFIGANMGAGATLMTAFSS